MTTVLHGYQVDLSSMYAASILAFHRLIHPSLFSRVASENRFYRLLLKQLSSKNAIDTPSTKLLVGLTLDGSQSLDSNAYAHQLARFLPLTR